MGRLIIMMGAVALLVACSQNEAGKKAILDQCLAGGQPEGVCECLARVSDQKLDKELFDVVVLGAEGREAEAAARVEALPANLKAKFMLVIPDIQRECGADPAS